MENQSKVFLIIFFLNNPVNVSTPATNPPLGKKVEAQDFIFLTPENSSLNTFGRNAQTL